MDKLVIMDVAHRELPEQIKQFVQDLNWLRDEGFVDFIEDPSGEIRIYPTAEAPRRGNS